MKSSMWTFVVGVCCMALLLATSDAFGQRGGGPGGGGPGGGFGGGFGGGRGPGGFGGGPLELAQRADVQKELGLSEKQISEIEAIAESQREGQRGQFQGFQGLQDLSDDERRARFQEMQTQREEAQKKVAEQVNALLTAPQKSRLSELGFQMNLQRGALEGALSGVGVELSEADQEKLREAQQAAQEKIREQIAALQRQANAEALAAVIPAADVSKYQGELFQFDPESNQRFQGFGGGGGNRGGRGGDPNTGRPQRPGGANESTTDPPADSTGRRSRR